MPKNTRISQYKLMLDIKQFLKGRKSIFDVGTGSIGGDWWNHIDKDASITGIETQFFPSKLPKHVRVYKLDAGGLAHIKKDYVAKRLWFFGKFLPEKVRWLKSFDLVVANHVLEHVDDFPATVQGIAKLLKKGGRVYAGFPDHRNFTDVFYHLIHPNGGGHVQLLTDEIVEKEFEKNGMKLVSKGIWPDDWLWFEKLYNWKTYMWSENKFLSQEKIEYLAGVFRKELTHQKGYFYGWEMVFEKR